MPNQVAAHGFDLTDAIRESCLEETKEKLMSIAQNNFSSRWTLSLEKLEHVAHISWSDGPFHGDATVKSNDMYQSIHQAAKKAFEQIKKAHEKRNDHNHTQKEVMRNLPDSAE